MCAYVYTHIKYVTIVIKDHECGGGVELEEACIRSHVCSVFTCEVLNGIKSLSLSSSLSLTTATQEGRGLTDPSSATRELKSVALSHAHLAGER